MTIFRAGVSLLMIVFNNVIATDNLEGYVNPEVTTNEGNITNFPKTAGSSTEEPVTYANKTYDTINDGPKINQTSLNDIATYLYDLAGRWWTAVTVHLNVVFEWLSTPTNVLYIQMPKYSAIAIIFVVVVVVLALLALIITSVNSKDSLIYYPERKWGLYKKVGNSVDGFFNKSYDVLNSWALPKRDDASPINPTIGGGNLILNGKVKNGASDPNNNTSGQNANPEGQ